MASDSVYFVNVKNGYLYAQPDLKHRDKQKTELAVQLTEKPAPKKVPGWVYGDLTDPDLANAMGPNLGWVPKDNLVHWDSFRKIGKGWPVRYYCYWDVWHSEPRVIFEATFRSDGSADIIVQRDSEDTYKFQTERHKGHVYQSGNVYLLKYGPGHKEIGFAYGYDSKEHMLYGGIAQSATGQGYRYGYNDSGWFDVRFGYAAELTGQYKKYCTHYAPP